MSDSTPASHALVRRLAAACAALACMMISSGAPVRASAASTGPCSRSEPRAPSELEASTKPARLVASDPRIELPFRGSISTRLALELPATPSPLDVYFLVDTTSSMDSAICGIREGLFDVAADLAAAGIDARFGVGEYRVYANAGAHDSTDEFFPYRRVRDVGALDQGLVHALYGLKAGQGGDETQLAALYQSVAGVGQDVPPKGRSYNDIPSGAQAHFRHGALRVVVNVTDEPFSFPTKEVPVPWPATVIAAMKHARTLQIGLAVGPLPEEDLAEIARGTGALAPSGGVDCDGDGRADVRRGKALVCVVGDAHTPNGPPAPIEPLNLTPAITSMLKAIKDRATVHFASSDTRVIRSIEVLDPAVVNLRSDHRLRLRAEVSCANVTGMQRVVVSARVRDRTVARAPVSVSCGEPPAPAVIPPRHVAAVAPQPVPAQQPANAPNPGMAAAPQSQLQHAAQDASDVVDYEMSAHRSNETAPLLGGAVLISALALAFARQRTAPQRATIRSKGNR